jgi:hypothetical protein
MQASQWNCYGMKIDWFLVLLLSFNHFAKHFIKLHLLRHTNMCVIDVKWIFELLIFLFTFVFIKLALNWFLNDSMTCTIYTCSQCSHCSIENINFVKCHGSRLWTRCWEHDTKCVTVKFEFSYFLYFIFSRRTSTLDDDTLILIFIFNAKPRYFHFW